MRYLLFPFLFLILISLSGCQDKKQLDQEAQAQHDAKIAQQARKELLEEIAAKENQTHMSSKHTKQKEDVKEANQSEKLTQMGIRIEKNSITIDTNKTKTFFNDLSKQFDFHMKKLSDDLEKGIIDTKEAGIELNNKHMHIDFNKTQNMLENWGKKMQVFVKDLDTLTNNLETNTTK